MENTLTKEDIQDLRELFQFYDKAGTGVVPVEKIRAMLQSTRFAVDAENLKKLLSDIDPDRKGFVTFDRLLAGLQKKSKEGDTKQELINAFRVFDRKGTGYVAAAELIETISKLKNELGVNESEISQLVRDADFDGDGLIDYQEFVQMLFEIEQLY